MDRFKELGIDTHGRTSGKMKTKCPWCHAQRTDKRDKSLSVNLDTKLYLCHYCGAHGSAAIYAGKGRKLGDPLVKFPTATGSSWRPRVCWPAASSMRTTIWTASPSCSPASISMRTPKRAKRLPAKRKETSNAHSVHGHTGHCRRVPEGSVCRRA